MIVKKREELGLTKEKVLSCELDRYMEAHWMRRRRVRNSDCFVSLRLCDFRERGGVRHNQGFDMPSGSDTMKRNKEEKEKIQSGVNLERILI